MIDVNKPFMNEYEIIAIESILKLLSKDSNCLEWGSGSSTLYFSKIIDENSSWLSIEHSSDWHDEVMKELVKEKRNNVELKHIINNTEFTPGSDGTYSSFYDYIFEPLKNGDEYDFILVDGRARAECMQVGWMALKHNGVMILHDAQREYYHRGFPRNGFYLSIRNPNVIVEEKPIELYIFSKSELLMSKIYSNISALIPEDMFDKHNFNLKSASYINWEKIRAMKEINLYAGDLPSHPAYNKYFALSITKNDEKHLLHDMQNNIPIADSTVDSFQSEDVFEHIEKEKVATIINEIYRVLKPGANFRLSLPDYRCDILRKRSKYDAEGNIIFDPAGGGTEDNPGHKWFPTYQILEEILRQTKFYEDGVINFLHYYESEEKYHTYAIDYSKGFVQRSPDHDERVADPYRPMSLIVDLIKGKSSKSTQTHIDYSEKSKVIEAGKEFEDAKLYDEALKIYLFYSLNHPADDEINEIIDNCMSEKSAYENTETELVEETEAESAKISVVSIVLNGMPFLEYSLKSVYDFAHEIIIVEGAVEKCKFAANHDGSSMDNTIECIKNFPDPENKIKLIQGLWPEKLEMQNRALEEVTGDYVWLVDSDEVYRTNDVVKIINIINEDPEISQINFIPDNFWKGFDHIFESPIFFEESAHYRRIFKFTPGAKFSSHRPPRMQVSENKFTDQGKVISGNETREMGIIPFHYSYVLDNQVKQKIRLYKEYAWDKLWNIDLDNWLEQYFLNWTPGNSDILSKKYAPWTGDPNSVVKKHHGMHPEVMTDFIGNFKGQKKKVKIAGIDDKDKDLTQIQENSEFEAAIKDIFIKHKPKKILETGTYLGTGTTRIIASCIKELGLDSKFYSVEVNPFHVYQAKNNLTKLGLYEQVDLLNGVSVPKSLLPSISEIRKNTVENIEYENIFVDHLEHERALKYFKETDFDEKDDVISYVIKEFEAAPDFVLLDSAGHMGFIEFNYIIQKIKSECIIALDDINHIKHHQSYLMIESDPRFELLVKSDEKFGFCIAKYYPEKRKELKNKKKLLWIRPDSIGDTVIAASLLEGISEKYYDYDIIAVCQSHIASFYEVCPYVSDVFSFKLNSFLNDEKYRIDLIHKLHAIQAEIVINSVYSRSMVTDFLSLNLGAKEKIAFYGDCSNISNSDLKKNNRHYTKLVDTDSKKNELEKYCDFAKALELPDCELNPMVWSNETDKKTSDELFRRFKLDPDKTIALFAGAQFEVRIYEKYGKALEQICKENDYTVISLGSEADVENSLRNTENLENVIDLCGKTSIEQAAEIIGKCKFAVGAETGLAHIAAAMETPHVIILGGGHFGRFMPYSKYTTIVADPKECFNCNWNCHHQTAYCIKNIEVKVLQDAILHTINKNRFEKATVFVQDRSWEKRNIGLPEHKAIQELIDPHKNDIYLVSFNEEKPLKLYPTNENNYLVSAIVSTYNSERYISDCLNDLLRQSIIEHTEIIVIDSGSEENESEIVRKYQEKYPNIKLLRTEERESIYAAWNRAIEMAEGKYITNANTDDRHRRDAFELMSNILENDPEIALVYSDSYITRNENETFEKNSAELMYKWPDFNILTSLSTVLFGSQPMWRRSVHKDIGAFNTKYEIAGDYEFFLKVAYKYGAAHFREPLGLFLQRSESKSGKDNFENTIYEILHIAKKFRNNIKLSDIYPDLAKDINNPVARAATKWDLANLCLMSPYPDFEMAISLYEKAIKEPSLPLDLAQTLRKMFHNNAGIMLYCSGDKEQGLKMLSSAIDLPESTANINFIDYCEKNKITPTPHAFAVSMINHKITKSTRKATAYEYNSGEIVKVDAHQEYWNVYEGSDGVPIENKISDMSNGEVLQFENRKLRILITMYGWNDTGGGTIQPRNVAKRLSELGHEVCVFYAGGVLADEYAPYHMQKHIDSDVKLAGVFNRATVFLDQLNPEREVYDKSIVKLFKKTIDEFKPDIVHINNFLGLSFGIAKTAKEMGLPVVYTPHNYHLIDPALYMFRSDLKNWENTDFYSNSELAEIFPQKMNEYDQRISEAKKLLNNDIDLTLAISNKVKSILFDFSESKNITVVHQMPQAVELFNTQHRVKRNFQRRLRVGFIGSVIPQKGVHKIVSAAQMLDDQSIEFKIFGEASQVYRDELIKLDRRQRIQWMQPYNAKDLPRIANEIDVLIVPSIWQECAGLVNIEAMAMGLPVIAANIGGIPDFVHNGKNGLLYEYDSEEDLAWKIEKVNGDRSVLQNFSDYTALSYNFNDYVNHLVKTFTYMIDKGRIDPEKAKLLYYPKERI